jgi:hypothetical protein
LSLCQREAIYVHCSDEPVVTIWCRCITMICRLIKFMIKQQIINIIYSETKDQMVFSAWNGVKYHMNFALIPSSKLARKKTDQKFVRYKRSNMCSTRLNRKITMHRVAILHYCAVSTRKTRVASTLTR